jgi:hypothetical protein
MPANSQFWTNFHQSVFHNAAGPLRSAAATPRPSGALRYTCPMNGSLVLVTDDETLARLGRPRARLRCIDCGEMHLLTQDDAVSPEGELVLAKPFKL